MGSFYATCSISDLSITDGDEMYMQLLLPTWVTNPYSIDGEKIGCGEKGLRVSNEGALGEFVPFGFPINGNYADYGDIDNIKRDRNIEMLEDFFNVSIDTIISCATDDRWYKHGYKPQIEENEEEEYSGQFKSWVVGNNKMKNIDILKKITVTYFRKEHYDFLSTNVLGVGDYYNNERQKRLDTMIKLLSHLEKERPKKKKRKVLTAKDITDKQRETYSTMFAGKQTDEEILSLLNFTNDSLWWSPFEYKFYIGSIASVNMFKELPIGSLDADDVRKQSMFINNMNDLYKVLRPSYYGSQQDNYAAYVKFHEYTTKLVGGVVFESKKDNIESEISWILKSNLEKIPNKETVEKIKRDIREFNEEYGYNIKLD